MFDIESVNRFSPNEISKKCIFMSKYVKQVKKITKSYRSYNIQIEAEEIWESPKWRLQRFLVLLV